MNGQMVNPNSEDVQLLMDTFHVDKDKAIRMIEGGWNVDYMKKGIFDTIDAEVNLESKVNDLKKAVDSSLQKTAEFQKDFK